MVTFFFFFFFFKKKKKKKNLMTTSGPPRFSSLLRNQRPAADPQRVKKRGGDPGAPEVSGTPEPVRFMLSFRMSASDSSVSDLVAPAEELYRGDSDGPVKWVLPKPALGNGDEPVRDRGRTAA